MVRTNDLLIFRKEKKIYYRDLDIVFQAQQDSRLYTYPRECGIFKEVIGFFWHAGW